MTFGQELQLVSSFFCLTTLTTVIIILKKIKMTITTSVQPSLIPDAGRENVPPSPPGRENQIQERVEEVPRRETARLTQEPEPRPLEEIEYTVVFKNSRIFKIKANSMESLISEREQELIAYRLYNHNPRGPNQMRGIFPAALIEYIMVSDAIEIIDQKEPVARRINP